MKRMVVCLMVFMVTVLVALPPSRAAAQAPVKLKFSNFFAATHQYAVLGQQFCEEIKKRTNGKVEVTYYPGGILTSATKMFEGVVNGVSDIGLSHCEYTRGRFPVTETLSFPLGYSSGYVAGQVANDFYNQFPTKEWDAVQVLWFYSTGPQIVSTVKKPVRTLEDLKGQKIRTAGRPADILRSVGGTPVAVEMADIYDGLQRGVVDGLLSSMEVQKGWKTGEIIKYASLSYKAGTVFTFYVVMNKNKWSALPEDAKKVFKEVSLQFQDKYGIASNDIDIEGREYLKKNGGQIVPFPDEEAKKWAKAADPVLERHIKDLEGKGYKKADVEAYVKFVQERIPVWAKKEKELKIASPY
jgi:TRAP-type C4-dicarboxylate transport system substrate-binding protein